LNKGAHVAFVPIGIVTVLLGPLLPTLSARWSLNYSQAGSLFTAQFLGSTLGVIVSGMIVSRWGFRRAISAGLLAMAVGIGALPSSPRFLGIACIFGYGIGLGLAIPAINLFVAAMNPVRRSTALSLLNFYWSAGAVACPFLVAAAVRADKIQLFLVMLAAFLLLVFLGIVVSPSSFVEPASLASAPAPNEGPLNVRSVLWNRSGLLVLSALFFLYVGAENAFGGWIASYAQTFGSVSTTLPVMTPSFFYVALLLGRWAAPLILRRMDEIKAARSGLAIAATGMAGLILSRSLPLLVVSVTVAGLGLAAIYPITISRLSQEFGPAAARAGSVMFTMANFGGASLPWLVGHTSHHWNDLRAGFAIPLVATVLMYALYCRKPSSGAAQTASSLAPELL
jgi:MFS transporter, FHS family, glucose/mannose:H+ symporter